MLASRNSILGEIVLVRGEASQYSSESKTRGHNTQSVLPTSLYGLTFDYWLLLAKDVQCQADLTPVMNQIVENDFGPRSEEGIFVGSTTVMDKKNGSSHINYCTN
jgi:hypothetical protein